MTHALRNVKQLEDGRMYCEFWAVSQAAVTALAAASPGAWQKFGEVTFADRIEFSVCVDHTRSIGWDVSAAEGEASAYLDAMTFVLAPAVGNAGWGVPNPLGAAVHGWLADGYDTEEQALVAARAALAQLLLGAS